MSPESTFPMHPHPHCLIDNYFSISIQIFHQVAPHFFSAQDSPSNIHPKTLIEMRITCLDRVSAISEKGRGSEWAVRVGGDCSRDSGRVEQSENYPKRCKTSSVGQSAGLLILRSSVRFRQKLKKLRTQINPPEWKQPAKMAEK